MFVQHTEHFFPSGYMGHWKLFGLLVFRLAGTPAEHYSQRREGGGGEEEGGKEAGGGRGL